MKNLGSKVILLEKLLLIYFFLHVVYTVGSEVHGNVVAEVNYDWRFHSCYAESLDASVCSGGNYKVYAPLLFLPVNFLLGLGFPLWLLFVIGFIIVFTLISIVLVYEGGFYGFAWFFFVIPFIEKSLGLLEQVNWLYNVRTGFLPFYLALAFGLLLLVFWDRLKNYQRVLLLLAIVFSHNYGLWLAVYILGLVGVEKLFKLPRVELGLVLSLFLVGFHFIPDRLLVLIELFFSVIAGRGLALFVDGLTGVNEVEEWKSLKAI